MLTFIFQHICSDVLHKHALTKTKIYYIKPSLIYEHRTKSRYYDPVKIVRSIFEKTNL